MNLTLSDGTSQQQRWVNDAIAQCSYPLDSLVASVVVEWADSLPVSSDIGHAHSYMVTEGSAGSYTITIATWADDPSAPGNSGLPNPAQDTYEFYKQSFVHELGHVIHFELITTDPQRTRAAGYFWHPDTTDGSLRHYGALADWSASVWQDNIMEALAECIKCATYTGRLIYLNRSSWNVDEVNWQPLMGMLYPSGGTIYYDPFDTTPAGMGGSVTVVDGELYEHTNMWIGGGPLLALVPDWLVTVKIINDIAAADPMLSIFWLPIGVS